MLKLPSSCLNNFIKNRLVRLCKLCEPCAPLATVRPFGKTIANEVCGAVARNVGILEVNLNDDNLTRQDVSNMNLLYENIKQL